jgi:two-component system, NtrC family, nitrogen regulation sensor histidine kinase NtrY
MSALSLRGKVALALVVVFLASLGVLVLVVAPVLDAQRQRLLEEDRRFLSTLRRNYEREFVYDLLSRNRESLAVHLADLASQEGVLWVRIQAGGLDLGASADRGVVVGLVGPDAEPFVGHEGVVLLVDRDGEADLVGPGGKPLLQGRHAAREEPRAEGAAPPPGQDAFRETVFGNARVLSLVATLQAAGEPYGRLHLLKSLAPLERSERLTRSLLYGGMSLSFVAVLLLLNLLLSRMVLAPVRRVNDAMARAATGDLRVRLELPSRDEVGSIAESFNGMVGELEASRQQVESYSRNLESMVEARTSELRASEASLLGLKNHLFTVIANVGTGVLSLDAEGRVETVNGRAGEILGLDPERARGRTLEEVLAGAGKARLLEAVAAVRDGREESREAQIACALPQGRRTLSLVVKALHGEGSRRLGTVVVVEDLTQILASQRLEAWKEAVERVIHEIKNPLTPVGLAGETLKSAWGSDPARFAAVFPSAIDMILGAVRDLKELIGEFSRFSRLPPMRPERQDPNELVKDVLSPYTRTPPERVRVTTELAADVPEVEADADQIKRVLLNVINNALEAMGEKGGTLRLLTRREPDGVVIRVEDDGPGVEDVERIFEPHYTTKVKGTGLGLAIARQIVSEHGGSIRAESRPGDGTSVRIELPAAPSPAPKQ